MPKKPLTSQQKAYKQQAKHRADFQRLLNEETREAAKRLKQRFSQFKELDAIPNNRIFAPTPKGQGKTKPIIKMVELLLDDRQASKKQIEILRAVQEAYPEIKLAANIWSKELHPAVLKKIKDKIAGNMADPVSVRGLKKLSEIRKVIYATRKVKGAKKVLKKTIALSKAEVVIGRTVYPVETRNKGKPSQKKAIRVTVRNKREWINFAPLCALLLEE